MARVNNGRSPMADSSTDDAGRAGRGSPPNLLFRLVIPAAGLFVVTILAVLASVLSDPRAPAVQLLNEHGGRLLAIEVVCVLVLGVAAMTVDRIQILRDMKREATSVATDSVDAPEDRPDGAESQETGGTATTTGG